MVVVELTAVSEGHVTADVEQPLEDRAGCEAARRSLVVPTVYECTPILDINFHYFTRSYLISELDVMLNNL